VVLLNEKATMSKINSELIGKKLQNKIISGKTELFIYFSGHGLPNVQEKLPYLAPFECDRNEIKQTAISLNDLFQKFNDFKARSITVVIDACFSGQPKGRPENNLFAAKPAFIQVKSPELLIDNAAVFYSSAGDQISSWMQNEKHSIFTYYFLKGLQGAADGNQDNQISLEEMDSYLQSKVPEEARRQSREQTPQVIGKDKNRILVKY
jgi:uncharacterized caspase-like protein